MRNEQNYKQNCVRRQVSHHPPMVAQFCEGAAGWQCWQEFTMTTKFRGKYLQVVPLGGAFAHFPASGNKYTWRKVSRRPSAPPSATCHRFNVLMIICR